MEVGEKEVQIRINEQDIINWINRERPDVKLKEIIYVHGEWDESSDDENKEILIDVKIKEDT